MEQQVRLAVRSAFTDLQDGWLKEEFQNIHETMNQRFEDVDQRFEAVDQRFEALEHRFDRRFKSLEAQFRNSKIVHLQQKLYPMSRDDLPSPKEFPRTLLALYSLQLVKNHRKLRVLLVYYQLDTEFIQLSENIKTSNLNLDSEEDSDSDSAAQPRHTEAELRNAIASYPWLAVSTLGAHLGVDCDALHDRVEQIRFQQKTAVPAVGSKRPAADVAGVESGPDARAEEARRLVDAALNASPKQPPELELESSEGKYTRLHWEVDSEKFRRETAHLKLTDNPPFSLPGQKREFGEGQRHIPERPKSDRASRRSGSSKQGDTEKISSTSSESNRPPR